VSDRKFLVEIAGAAVRFAPAGAPSGQHDDAVIALSLAV
jgi:hypothetical protein